MHLQFTPEEDAFREEVRAFLAAQLPARISRRVLAGLRVSPEDTVAWQRILHARGWGAPGWPTAFGGTGWDPLRQALFDEECEAAGAPLQLPFGLRMVGPVIQRFGSPAQQARFLPRIVAGEDWWCQGYSEPGSGSDLASLGTRAERRGDRYVVNGQKIWITLAQHADWIFCLVRTDAAAKPQAGISFLLIDMRAPGISVRPIHLMGGQLDGPHEVNEVFFEDVEVPVDNRVGEENSGWTYAKFLLGHERAGIAAVGHSKRELRRLRAIAAAERKHGRPLVDDPAFAARLAQVEIELMALEITNLRVLSAEAARKAPGPEASLLKIKGSEIQQQIAELMLHAAADHGLVLQPEPDDGQEPAVGPAHALNLGGAYANLRKTTIYGGANEIQKNIIGQMLLGL